MSRPRATGDGPRATGADALRAYFARTSQRLRWIGVAEGAAIGLTVGGAVVVARLIAVNTWVAAATVCAVAAATGVAARLAYTSRRRARVAELVERRAPHCRNVVVTARELLDAPSRTQPYIADHVCAQAERLVATLEPASLFPAKRALSALGAGAAVCAIALVATAARRSDANAPLRPEPGVASIDAVTVTVTPPVYSGIAAQTLRDPARIEALAGSRIALTVRARAGLVTMETVARRDTLAMQPSAGFIGEFVASADGFVAIAPESPEGRAGARRLIGLTVTPDAAPRVRVTAPGRDVFLPDANRTLDVAIDANDDLALATLRLRYTKVSGSGEQFSFAEGELPVTVARADDRAWTARGPLRLADLKLERGDVVVYRAVATDRRPGAPPAESDAFIVEIVAPGAVASEGFAMDDERDRYAISQQMVILKTQRLIARRDSLSRDAVQSESMQLAAEQRQVRAEFVFMMGGELAEDVIAAAELTDIDETAEAEAEADILAGRLANQGRVALLRAIRAMSRAAAALSDTNLTRALADERAALENLQRAFSRTRYILRALTQRERLDLTRRLTGVLAGAARDVHPVPEVIRDARVLALRAILADVASLSMDSAQAATRLSERILRVDPSDRGLAQIAARLNDAGTALLREQHNDARRLLDSAATDLAATVRASLRSAPGFMQGFDAARLDGALVDELRRRLPGGAR